MSVQDNKMGSTKVICASVCVAVAFLWLEISPLLEKKGTERDLFCKEMV
jgi:hypothetical protein